MSGSSATVQEIKSYSESESPNGKLVRLSTMEEEWIEVIDRKKKPEKEHVAVGGKRDFIKVQSEKNYKSDRNDIKTVFPKTILKRGDPPTKGGASAKSGANVGTVAVAKPISNQMLSNKPKAVIVNKSVSNVESKPQKRQPVALFDLILAPKVKPSKPENISVKPTVSLSSNKGIDRDAKTKHKLDAVAYYDENNKLAMRTKKKKFSIIKKKILLERLNRYIKMKQSEVAMTSAQVGEDGNEVLCVQNFVLKDELQDNDERKEIEDNISEIVSPFGSFDSISFGPGFGTEDQIVYVRFDSASAASAASISLNGFVIGGNKIKTYTISKSQVLLSTPSGNETTSSRDDDHILMTSTTAGTVDVAAVLCLENLVFEGDVTDADETDEMLQDVRRLCSSKDEYMTSIWIESVATDGVSIEMGSTSSDASSLATPWGVVEYFSIDDAASHCRQLHGVIVGGTCLEAYLYDYALYKQSVFTEQGLIPCAHASPANEYGIKILGFIEDAQVEDDDEANDTKAELQKLVMDLLPQADASVIKEIVFIPSTSHVNYHDTVIALTLSFDDCRSLLHALEGLEIGGVTLEYQLVVGSDPLRVVCDTNKNSVLVIKHFITDDDIAVASVDPLTHDPSGFYSHTEELLAIKMDLLTLAKGDDATRSVVKRLLIESSRASRPSTRCLPVCVGFSSLSAAEEMMIYLEGTMIAGGVIKSFLRRTDDTMSHHDHIASVSMASKSVTSEQPSQVVAPVHAQVIDESTSKAPDTTPGGIVSKYVEASTAPKQPRHTSVCMLSVKRASDEIDTLIQTTLNTLAGYQKRLKENEPLKAKQKMRFVCGLKQCLNGVKSERAILVLLAPDTEESEALDSKMDDLINEAHAREIPILFCLSRRKLAKSILASTRQAAVAVYNADGVFKEVQRIAQYAKTPFTDDSITAK